jgi:5,10-methylenetetrahydromethanopterin reductase
MACLSFVYTGAVTQVALRQDQRGQEPAPNFGEHITMKIGLMTGGTPGADGSVSNLVAFAQDADARGFATLWMAHIRGQDALMLLAYAGTQTQNIELATAVTPIQPRHPVALAQQALTASAMSNGRFTLGIGLSHKVVIEGMYGLSFDKPAKIMREYLAVTNPLLNRKTAKHQGDMYNVHMGLDIPDAVTPVPTMIAAMGPMMLGLAGAATDGTILWMTGPKTIEEYVRPTMESAAEKAGRPTPRTMAAFPVLLTNDEAAGRALIGEQLVHYGQLPSYRGMLDREGVAGPEALAVVGDEAALRAAMTRIADAGTTDFAAALIEDGSGSAARTLDFLQSCL